MDKIPKYEGNIFAKPKTIDEVIEEEYNKELSEAAIHKILNRDRYYRTYNMLCEKFAKLLPLADKPIKIDFAHVYCMAENEDEIDYSGLSVVELNAVQQFVYDLSVKGYGARYKEKLKFYPEKYGSYHETNNCDSYHEVVVDL